LSVRIEKGQVVGLLGLNGAGKTTTLRILACDLLPTSGTVRVDGMDVVETPDRVKAKVGYLPDTPPVYPEMSITEYLTFAARLRGVPRSDVAKRVDDAIEQTELGTERNRLIESLSHGFRQRVGIAQAIVHRPQFVVLDEPISGLDPAQIVEMRSLVRSLSGGHTVVVSSHNLPEISETCDRLLVIKDGRIVADGTEQELTSAQQGMKIEVTVRGTGPSADVAEAASAVLSELRAVREVRIRKPSEPGEGIATLAISSDADVRDLVCRTLVHSALGILELTRAERELENAFLQLLASGPGADDSSEAADASNTESDEDEDEDEARKDKEAVS
jgi:ABC-2 type transport system ATP-binding protein